MTAAAFVAEKDDLKKLHVNKDLIGQDATVLAKHAAMTVPPDTLLLYGETAAEKSNELLLHMLIAVVSVSLLIALTLGRREAGDTGHRR